MQSWQLIVPMIETAKVLDHALKHRVAGRVPGAQEMDASIENR